MVLYYLCFMLGVPYLYQNSHVYFLGTVRSTLPLTASTQRQIHHSIRLLNNTEAQENKPADDIHTIITDTERSKGITLCPS